MKINKDFKVYIEKKGRATGAKGEKSGHSKLKQKDIKEIKRLFFTEKVYQKVIAKKYGVSQVIISNIILGKTYNLT